MLALPQEPDLTGTARLKTEEPYNSYTIATKVDPYGEQLAQCVSLAAVTPLCAAAELHRKKFIMNLQSDYSECFQIPDLHARTAVPCKKSSAKQDNGWEHVLRDKETHASKFGIGQAAWWQHCC
jgi:hypothetical protein